MLTFFILRKGERRKWKKKIKLLEERANAILAKGDPEEAFIIVLEPKIIMKEEMIRRYAQGV